MDDRTSRVRQHAPAPALGALAPVGPALDRLDPDRVLTAGSRKAAAIVALRPAGVDRW